jgi:hypothetical protein
MKRNYLGVSLLALFALALSSPTPALASEADRLEFKVYLNDKEVGVSKAMPTLPTRSCLFLRTATNTATLNSGLITAFLNLRRAPTPTAKIFKRRESSVRAGLQFEMPPGAWNCRSAS